MKKALLIIPILLALVVMPAMAYEPPYEPIGDIQRCFIYKYGCDNININDLPNVITYKDMVFYKTKTIIGKDGFKVSYNDGFGYYHFEISSTNGVAGLLQSTLKTELVEIDGIYTSHTLDEYLRLLKGNDTINSTAVYCMSFNDRTAISTVVYKMERVKSHEKCIINRDSPVVDSDNSGRVC